MPNLSKPSFYIVNNLISILSKPSLYILKYLVSILSKPSFYIVKNLVSLLGKPQLKAFKNVASEVSNIVFILGSNSLVSQPILTFRRSRYMF